MRLEVAEALVEIANERGGFQTLLVGSASFLRVPTDNVEIQIAVCKLLKRDGHVELSRQEMREMHDYPICLIEQSPQKGLKAEAVTKQGDAVFWKRLQNIGTARSIQAAALVVEEEEEPVKPKIEELPRGSVPDDGWYFTSYRLPLDLARQVDAIAKDNETSRQNVVISLLKHGVAQYGATRSTSDLEASEHAKPPKAGTVAPPKKQKEEPPKKEATKELQKKPASGKQPFRVKISRPGSK